MLRSCYSTLAQFGSDPTQQASIQWYWADATAKDLGIPTTFSSRNYAEKGTWPDIGEVEGDARPWANGSFPIIVPGTGPFCGSPGVWANGYTGTVPPAYPRSMFGLLICCGQLVAPAGEPCIAISPSTGGQNELLQEDWLYIRQEDGDLIDLS